MDDNEKGPYSLLQGERSGKPWFAIIRKGFSTFSEKNNLPWLLQVHVDAEATDQGLVSDEEAEALNTLEDFLYGKIQPLTQTFFVGRTTWNKTRSLYYYLSDPKPVSDELNKIISQGQYTREFQYEISKDQDWKKMSELIPNIENI